MIKKGDVVTWAAGSHWVDNKNHVQYTRGIIKDIYQDIMYQNGKPVVYRTRYLVQPESGALDMLMSSNEFKLSNEPNDILKGML